MFRMGHDAKVRGQRRGEVIHLKKLFNGEKTADELHRELSFHGRRCQTCDGPPAIRIRMLVQLKELEERRPDVYALLLSEALKRQQVIPTIPTTYGAMVRLNEGVFCDHCAISAERAAAHPPTGYRDLNWLVEIDRGPGKDRTTVQVPKTYSPLAI